MTTSLTFTVTFHGAFLAATGRAVGGYDASVDPADPVRESAVKGAMRGAAVRVLRMSVDRLEQLFGSTARPSSWAWTVLPADGPSPTADRHRVAVHPVTHVSEQDMLQRARVALPHTVVFRIDRFAAAPDAQVRMEGLALTAAARAVHRLGAGRRRGLGWVGVEGGADLDEPAVRSVLDWGREQIR